MRTVDEEEIEGVERSKANIIRGARYGSGKSKVSIRNANVERQI